MLYEKNHSLKAHNTFGIDCHCDHYGEYESPEELLCLLTRHPEARKLHIGQGSNLLFVAERYHGLVLHNAMRGVTPLGSTRGEARLEVGGGLPWDGLVLYCLATGLHGLENLSLVPGEVGAAAVQNIGAYGVEVCRFVESVTCMELATGKLRSFSADECHYAYRQSRFKRQPDAGHWAVLSVTLRLPRHFSPVLDYEGLRRQMEAQGISEASLTPQQLRDIVVSLRQRKLPDPAVTGNAGSFFKNPTVSPRRFRELQTLWPDIRGYDTGEQGVKLSAAWLIDNCGWRGRSMGAAAVHGRHALVLVNRGGASGSDILALANAINDDVCRRFGVRLEPEVNIID